jgi:hypothetical protein
VHFPDALDEKVGGGLLEDNPTGAELHCLYKLILVFRGGEYDDFGLRPGVLQFLESRQTIEAGHFQIEQKNVRLMLVEHLQNFFTVTGFGYNAEVRLEGQ